MYSYDVIIIGSGPNGLAAAIAIAQEGLKVLVVEATETIGGGTRTAELTLPGYHHDVCSAVHPLGALSPFLKTLPLKDYGLEWLYPKISVAHPLDDGPAVLLKKSIQETAAGLGVDSESWTNLLNDFVNDGDALLEDLLAPLKFPNRPLPFMKFGLKAMTSAISLSNDQFKNERTKALFAGCAAHSVIPLDFKFSSAIGLVLAISGHLIDWPVAKGGSANITRSMAAYFRFLGGEIRTSFKITNLEELPSAKAYVFDTDVRQLSTIASNHLPQNFKKRLLKFNYGPGIFKIDWALDGSIPWKDPNCLRASTVHVGGTMNEIAESEHMAWHGKYCDKPFVLVCQQSEIDASRAPKGKHTGYAYCHVPHGSTIDMTQAIEKQLERFAPGFKDLILARHVTDPKMLNAYNLNNVGGSITGGANNFSQLFARPTLRWNPYATPNDKIFICSASTPPGGGVHGMCGYWAAKSVLKQLGVK